MGYADRPAMMAIGDSMYQGVRSLSFTADLGRWSPPAQVAAALRKPFLTPNPRLPFLFDLEQLCRQGGVIQLLLSIKQLALANIQAWQRSDPWSQYECFDNVAIGGAGIESLYTDTYVSYWGTIPGLVAKIQAAQAPDLTSIWALWYALNVCFTLNPQHRDELTCASQVQQVLDRGPPLLLINIGSNEGLFDAGFTGNLGNSTVASVQQIPGKMRELATRLEQLPKDTIIVCNALVRPRCIPNLMPAPEVNYYPGDGYFERYGPRIGSTQQNITGAQLAEFDELIASVNGDVKAEMERILGSRLRWADLNAASTSYDGKHYQDRSVALLASGAHHTLRNTPLMSLFGHLFGGGLAGIDNMHPTVVGYAKIADTVLATLGSPKTTDKGAAFLADSLLNNLPGDLTLVQAELSMLGAASAFAA